MKHKIFVYGTLKQGHGNNRIIADQKFLGPAQTELAAFQMYSLGGFPGVVRGTQSIKGELYEVDEEAFTRCDHLEGHPDFYKRESVAVMCDNGPLTMAWMYIFQGDTKNLKPVEGW